MAIIVEIWTVGSLESKSYVLLQPTNGEYWYVINGQYQLIPNKKENSVYIPYTEEHHEAHYLGDVEYSGDYNETISLYRDTKNIVGINSVKHVITENKIDDEPPF